LLFDKATPDEDRDHDNQVNDIPCQPAKHGVDEITHLIYSIPI
jgi:hypothetical protein